MSLAPARRRAILNYLAALSSHAANGDILHDVLNGMGIQSSADQVGAELAWLAEAELVSVTEGSGFVLAEITGRGVDVAGGSAAHPGVAPRKPRA